MREERTLCKSVLSAGLVLLLLVHLFSYSMQRAVVIVTPSGIARSVTKNDCNLDFIIHHLYGVPVKGLYVVG